MTVTVMTARCENYINQQFIIVVVHKVIALLGIPNTQSRMPVSGPADLKGAFRLPDVFFFIFVCRSHY